MTEPTPTARLVRLHVEGYRSLARVHLDDLGPRTVLIGANGAGKSNVLSFIEMLAKISSASLGNFVAERGGANALLHYGASQTPDLTIYAEFDQGTGHRNAYRARLSYAAGDKLSFGDEAAGHAPPGADAFRWTSLGSGHFESALAGDAGAGATARATAWCLQRLGFFHFHDTSRTAALRANARAADAKYLRSNGSNLAAYLRRLLDADEASQPVERAAGRRIEGWVRQIAPFIKSLDPADVGGNMVRLHWTDVRDEAFGPEHLSDGTLRAIALFTALGQPRDRVPMVTAIDEPELGLHPAALHLFCELVQSVSADRQVIVATQSKDLLDHFEASDVRVVETRDGATDVRRLDPAALASWLDDYRLSELYDSNVLGGRP